MTVDWRRVLLLTALGLLLIAAVAELWALANNASLWSLAMKDYHLYMAATSRWLASGAFYEPFQVAGPYTVTYGVILYPPQMLYLFVPFTALPWVLWWAIPMVLSAYMVAWQRPRLWAIVAMLAVAVAAPWSWDVYVSGTPTIWFVAAIALATRWRALSALILLKPTLLPFALLGVRKRGWWVVGAVMVGLSALTLTLTVDWLHVMLNAGGPEAGLFYSAQNVPLMLIPVIAWLGSSRRLVAGPLGAVRSPARSAAR